MYIGCLQVDNILKSPRLHIFSSLFSHDGAGATFYIVNLSDVDHLSSSYQMELDD